MSEQIQRRNEMQLIAHYFAPLCDEEAAFGLVDDAACLTPPEGHDLVISKDMLVSGIHFFAHDAPEDVARKALRVNLSDLAAKGAKPRGYLLGLGLPDDWTEDWLTLFCHGLRTDQDSYHLSLLGGDTVKSPERLVVSVTVIGLVPKGKAVLRQNAKAGDQLYVSGTVGDGALGLLARKGELDLYLPQDKAQFLAERFTLPTPRLALAPLIQTYASAAMDISDGLLGDAEKLARASGLALHIQRDLIPLCAPAHSLITQSEHFWSPILTGGDDYELLFTVPGDRQDAFIKEVSKKGAPVTRIGEVKQGETIHLLTSGGDEIPMPGHAAYQHF